jgi:hypothetical protein
MYRGGVKALWSSLGSHVSPIKLPLMTQTVESISAAEKNKDMVGYELRNKILALRKLLEDVKDDPSESTTLLRGQRVVLDSLGAKVDSTLVQLKEQQVLIKDGQPVVKALLQGKLVVLDRFRLKADSTIVEIQEQQSLHHQVHSVVSNIRERTTSILATATDILSLATVCLMSIRPIAQQLRRMSELCTKLTMKTREAIAELMRQCTSLLYGCYAYIYENNLYYDMPMPKELISSSIINT